MALAIFDLDNTLLGGDSDHAWGEFLVEKGLVDAESHRRQNDEFYRQYQEGGLDIQRYLAFALGPIAGKRPEELLGLQEDFLRSKVDALRLPAADALLDKHRQQGDRILIITATNNVVTAPIAAALGVETLLASEAEIVDGVYSGRGCGVPCFQDGKVTRLQAWLKAQGESLAGSWFYSDSHNDLPLLKAVDKPVAVDPDPRLRQAAEAAGWPVISLR